MKRYPIFAERVGCIACADGARSVDPTWVRTPPSHRSAPVLLHGGISVAERVGCIARADGARSADPTWLRTPPSHRSAPVLLHGGISVAERVGFEPTAPCRVTGFQDQLLKPLGHLSKRACGQRFPMIAHSPFCCQTGKNIPFFASISFRFLCP